MKIFKDLKRLFTIDTPIKQDGVRSYMPNTLKPYGQLANSILNINNTITGRKPLLANDSAAKQANYYFRVNPAVSNFVREVVNNSVGTTLGTLQSKINALSPESNQKLNSKIETAWIDYTNTHFDLSGRWTLNEFLEKAITNYLIEGEVNIRIFGEGKYSYQYQLLDFMSLDFIKLTGNCFNGVEIDGYTRQVAYWIVDSDEQRFRIPANQFVHFGNYASISDYRGTSLIAPGFDILDKIASYESAEINAAINEATKVIYYKSDNNYLKAYEGAATANEIAGFNPNIPSEMTTIPTYDPSQILAGSGVQSGGIAIEALPSGVDLAQLSSNHPNNGFVEATKMLYLILGSALGVPASTLLLNLSDANYSSMRAGEIFKRKMYRKLSTMLIKKIIEPVYENFINAFILANKADFPKVNGSYDVYKVPNFPMPKFPYVSPKDDVEADILALNNDLKLWSDLIAEQGNDFEDFLRQKKLDDEMMTIYGTSLKTQKDKDNMVEYYKVKQSNQNQSDKTNPLDTVNKKK